MTVELSSRTQKILAMAKAYASAREHAMLIGGLLIEALEPGQAEALAQVVDQGDMTGARLALIMDVSVQHATTLLKQLTVIGLLKRRAGNGREYVYELER